MFVLQLFELTSSSYGIAPAYQKTYTCVGRRYVAIANWASPDNTE